MVDREVKSVRVGIGEVALKLQVVDLASRVNL